MKKYHTKSFIMGAIFAIVFLFLPYVIYTWLKVLPNPSMLTRRDLEVSTKIYDRNGSLLYEIYADQNRNPIPIGEIPKNIIQATIAIEDKNFYKHQGFDPFGMARGFLRVFTKGRAAGGSTLTQQLVKNVLLTNDRTVIRKIKEFVIAVQIEND